jgi:glyoxylase-like metal-dependent hydrolase (beta-lactamase superfamily II)
MPGVWRWWAFSPEHRVELMSHAVRCSDASWVVFDPIPIEPRTGGLPGDVLSPKSIVLTNGNHLRDTLRWLARFPSALWIPPGIEEPVPGALRLTDGASPDPAWTVEPLAGGGPGELALRIPERDLVVFGDAVVHLAGRPLELLPDKYCSNPADLRRALRQLLTRPFARALFAHGDPMASLASDRIATLLSSAG